MVWMRTERKALRGEEQTMKEFADKIAVVTGGGTGMGRELVRQLVAEGCNVAMCDLSATDDGRDQSGFARRSDCRRACASPRTSPTCRTRRRCSGSATRSPEQQATDKIHLLFNNAGIGGGGSMIADSREAWERTFNICWGGVYHCTRAFLPMLQQADAGAHRQHQQRQRLLGIGRAAHLAHRVLCREVRGEGLHRGADHRSAPCMRRTSNARW